MLEAQARGAEAKAKGQDVQSARRGSVGHYAPQTESPEQPEQPETESQLDIATAMAKVRDSETRAREVTLKEKEAANENQNRDQDREAKERESAIQLAGDVIRAPTTETGGQVGVTQAGKKANKIIKDVDKAIKPE